MSIHEIHAPGTGALLGAVEKIEVADVARIVSAARAALPQWRRRAPHDRAEILRRACVLIANDSEALAQLHASESGKIIAQARFEVRGAARLLEANAELGRMWAGTIAPTGALPGGERDLTIVERVPLGVVVAVIPFNFPIELMIEKAAAALAVGNVVIVKAPPQNPLAIGRVVDLLHEAGVPADVLQMVSGDTPASAALCAAEGVDAVSLTGSVAAGVGVATATAAQLRPLHLELGGNGAALVMPDADLDYVVSETLRGRLLMNGQACAATKRVLAHRDIAGELTDRLEAALSSITPSDPLVENARLGPLIDERSAARVSAQVDRAIAQGGRRVLGASNDGAWFAPTLLTSVPTNAAVAIDDEIFGPVVTVVPVDDAPHGVAVANASQLRLTAAVFTQDIPTAMSIAAEFDYGGVVINGTNNYRPPVVPFGGVALAGAGREGIGFTIEEMTRTRFIALRNLRPAWDANTKA
ncbi:aldehyde dehydrogenase family protein [Microbacterium sp. NPDC076911]|uniref:aldehyde dehydrogenase family protein n=1 Tax=Microbacterium sp. NPDC076911 TaxID=3154958 RepID=UPI00344A1E41